MGLIGSFKTVFYQIQQRLLEHRELNLENAIEKALAMKVAQNFEFYALRQIPQKPSLYAVLVNE